MIEMHEVPDFRLNEKTRMVLISSGKYIGTQYSYKNVRIENDTLKFEVMINEFWESGGKITNAKETEVMYFINTVAQKILENMIEVIKLNSKLENN